jgi:hypothetical protein
MTAALRNVLVAAVSFAAVSIAATASVSMVAATPTIAAGRLSPLTISCANGSVYSLVPRTVSGTGDIVTARLVTGQRRGIPVRLVPMGEGYRYAGRGIWLDGIRSDAVLNFGPQRAVACGVAR